MIWCSRCLMPDTRPRVTFADGVCNACLYRDEYEKIDWHQRRRDFITLLGAYRNRGPYDCVVPFSGGKDSSAIAWRLKHEYGIRPLLVTYGQLLWTDVGRRNWGRVRDAGFDILYWGCDQQVSHQLARRFLIERGHPKQHYDAAVNAVPVIIAKQFGIPLIIYAEHGESFYGGHVLSEEHRRRRDLAEVLENQVGDDARNWATGGLTERDLFPYIYPKSVFAELFCEGAGYLADSLKWRPVSIEAVYWSYYHRWDIYENAKLCREKMGFERAQNFPRPGLQNDVVLDVDDLTGPLLGQFLWGKSDGSFEGFDSIDDKIDDLDYYLMYLKFGFGRAARMASRLIQCGHITREQGLALVRRYDGEAPSTYRGDVLEYLGMGLAEFAETGEKHRNLGIWEKDGIEWRLKNLPA